MALPLATVVALSRDISDHTPLLLDTGGLGHTNKQPLFKCELRQLLKEGFFELVAKIWKKENKGVTSIQRWQSKNRRLRSFLRGWAANVNGAYKKEKQEPLKKR